MGWETSILISSLGQSQRILVMFPKQTYLQTAEIERSPASGAPGTEADQGSWEYVRQFSTRTYKPLLERDEVRS